MVITCLKYNLPVDYTCVDFACLDGSACYIHRRFLNLTKGLATLYIVDS